MALQSGTSSINELQEVPPASKESATPSIGPRCRQTTWLHRLRLVHVVLTGYTSEVELVSQDKLCVRRVWLARPRSSLVQARARGLPRLLSALGIFSCRTYKIFSRSARVWLRQTSLHNLWRRCQGRQQKGFGTLQECLTSCDGFVCNHCMNMHGARADKLYQEMTLASSFNLAFQVSLTRCSYTYKVSNRNLYFQVGVQICCCPIDYTNTFQTRANRFFTYSIVLQW